MMALGVVKPGTPGPEPRRRRPRQPLPVRLDREVPARGQGAGGHQPGLVDHDEPRVHRRRHQPPPVRHRGAHLRGLQLPDACPSPARPAPPRTPAQEGNKDDSLFAAYGPNGGPGTAQWAVGAVVEDGGFGAWAAAPIVKCIFAALGDPSRMAPLVQSEPLDKTATTPTSVGDDAQLAAAWPSTTPGRGPTDGHPRPAPVALAPARSDVSARRLDWSILLHGRRPLRHRPHRRIYSATGPDAAAERPRPVLLRPAPGRSSWRGAVVVMVLAAVIDYRRLREWALFFFAVTTIAAAGRHRPGAGPQRRPGVVRHRAVPAATVGAGQGHAHPRAGLLRGQRSGRGPALPRLRPRARAHGRARC